MSPSRIASVAALLGGAAWLVRGLLIWGQETASGVLAEALLWAGTAAFAVGLAAAGYALVATAPIWLRMVVSVAVVLLVLAIWVLVDDALGSDWISALVGAGLAVAAGLWGLGRPGPAPVDPPPVRGRRAAR